MGASWLALRASQVAEKGQNIGHKALELDKRGPEKPEAPPEVERVTANNPVVKLMERASAMGEEAFRTLMDLLHPPKVVERRGEARGAVGRLTARPAGKSDGLLVSQPYGLGRMLASLNLGRV